MADGPTPDPDALLRELRDAGGPPPRPPLRIAEPTPSDRRGPAGGLVGRARRAVLRLITPALADMLTQLEADRARTDRELARLAERIDRIERGSPGPR